MTRTCRGICSMISSLQDIMMTLAVPATVTHLDPLLMPGRHCNRASDPAPAAARRRRRPRRGRRARASPSYPTLSSLMLACHGPSNPSLPVKPESRPLLARHCDRIQWLGKGSVEKPDSPGGCQCPARPGARRYY